MRTDTSLPLPRATTWKALQESRNSAVVRVLAQGLRSQLPEIRRRSIKLLLDRRDAEALRIVLANWNSLTADDRQLLRDHAHRLTAVAREFMHRGTYSEKKIAIEAIAALDLVDAFDAVLDYAVRHRHALQPSAAEAVLKICRRWGERARSGKDRPSIRTTLLAAVKQQLDDYAIHQSQVTLDAWLAVIHWDDGLQRAIIADSNSAIRKALVSRMATSSNREVIELLAGYLLRETTPEDILQVATQRPEIELAIHMARLMEGRSPAAVMRYLQKIPPLACLREPTVYDEELPENIRCNFWRIVAANGEDIWLVLQGALQLAESKSEACIEAAADMIRFGKKCNVESVVPALQEAILDGKLHTAELLESLCKWLNSDSRTLRSAAERFFEGFDFEDLMNRIKYWPARMCHAMAVITAQVDPLAKEKLKRELLSASPQRRYTALQIVQALECAEDFADQLFDMVHDFRLDIRVKAIDLLSSIRYQPLEKMLPDLMNDINTDIQDAADRAARRLGNRPDRTTPPAANTANY